MSKPGWYRPESGAVYSKPIDTLVRLFHTKEFREEVGITVSEVFEGGSLGQGTQVRYKHDIDLVIYSVDLRVEDAAVRRELFRRITEFLKKFGRDTIQYNEPHHTYVNGRRVTTGITFTYPLPENETIEVDLSLSPMFSDHHDLLTSLLRINKKERKLLSAVKWQTDFIAQQDQWVNQVKEFTRRVKAWRDLQWSPKEKGCPKSYFLSILVVTVYDSMPGGMKQQKRGQQQGHMKRLVPLMTNVFIALIKKIDKEGENKSLDLIVPVPERYSELRKTYEELLPPPPRIIDPVDPSKNFYHSGIYGAEQGKAKWASFVDKVEKLNLSPGIMEEHARKFKPK